LCFDHLVGTRDLLRNLFDSLFQPGILLNVDAALLVFTLFFAVLGDCFFFELADMARHTLEVLLELSDLLIRLKQVLRVEVTV